MSDEVRKRAVLYSIRWRMTTPVVDEGEVELLRKYNGLRNAIAHHYHLNLSKVEEALTQLDELYKIAVKLVRTAERLFG